MQYRKSKKQTEISLPRSPGSNNQRSQQNFVQCLIKRTAEKANLKKKRQKLYKYALKKMLEKKQGNFVGESIGSCIPVIKTTWEVLIHICPKSIKMTVKKHQFRYSAISKRKNLS